MVNIFETREITIGKTGFWKAELQRVSDWRKGIAVARYYKHSIKPSWKYFLIDEDYNYLYEKWSYEEDEIDGEQIERIFGGYYIVRDVILDGCRTFPGQDRDTEYYYSTCIKNVLDENGVVLSEEEKNEYLNQTPIKQTTEYGEGIVECESSFYKLDTYQYLFSIPKTLKPIGFYKDGKFRVGVVSDYRDFYIVVKETKIVTVFDCNQFKFIEKLLGIDIDKEKSLYLKPHNKYTKTRYSPTNKRPEETAHVRIIEPEAIVEIQNYALQFSVPYIFNVGTCLLDSHGIKRFSCVPPTRYYYVDNEWRKIEGSAAQKVYEKIFNEEYNRPNFIQGIERIAEEVKIDGEKYSLYDFP